ncbi:semaphorin-5B [Cloeon dipterum]|uniref:semaphorin-5B n=1 Tax=Cloeon dipterum TaxID=197152 RepID=UPI00321F7947
MAAFLCSAWLLLLLLSARGLHAADADSDFRYIPHEDLLASSDSFDEPGVSAYSVIQFDLARNQLLVGAKDSLFRLSLRGLSALERARWEAPVNKTILCQDKGQREQDCHNFVKVLQINGKKVFTCGTHAYSPLCSWREADNLNKVLETVSGTARCPYSPQANSTALMTRDGRFFAATTTDFSGADPVISRSMGGLETLRTSQYNSKWLSEPDFVGAFENDEFVYFLFRESAVEYINCGKIIYSRIARVCKNDTSGQLMLKDNWTTFLKARLNCSVPGQYPFYYNEIQGFSYDEPQGLVYATFTTPENSIAGSAICAFNMSAISTAFSGAYKHQAHPGASWERHSSTHSSHGKCPTPGGGLPRGLVDSSKYQLMDEAVKPFTLHPLHVSQPLERLTKIAITLVDTKLHKSVIVMFVATSEGKIKKLGVLPRTMNTCLLEVWEPFSPKVRGSAKIMDLKYLKETDSLYVASSEGVLRVPAQRCARFPSRQACLNAHDPHCGWNELKLSCTTAPNKDPLALHWEQSAPRCPVLTDPVDGSWGSWSAWSSCAYKQGSGDQCQCRIRQCNNPAPQHGGKDCGAGPNIEVTNCTQHGGWTAWSQWSACSQTCGVAVKSRRRTCGNPAPAFGGRVCVGQDHNEMYCSANPPCPAKQGPPPRDGHWSEWGSWSGCSAADCGTGLRTRRRKCDSPSPQNGGQECPGCAEQSELCSASCAEVRKFSTWTPWLAISANSSSGPMKERRYRFQCRAPATDPNQVKLTQFKEEERTCIGNTCSKPGSPSVVSQGQWGCWSDWSPCSVSCGLGVRIRSRPCLGSSCDGPTTMDESCEASVSCHSLAGWQAWTEWSVCNEEGEQYRKRSCLASKPGPQLCVGPNKQTRMCFTVPLENELNIIPDSSAAHIASRPRENDSVGIVLGASTAAFLAGLIAATAAVATIVIVKRRQRMKRGPGRVPGSPHYIPARQNPYVSVPMQRGVADGKNALLDNEDNTTPKIFSPAKPVEYETATIKRNSHSLANNHKLREDHDDHFF